MDSFFFAKCSTFPNEILAVPRSIWYFPPHCLLQPHLSVRWHASALLRDFRYNMPMTMTTLIFDLDGTLIDTASLVLPAFRQALRHFSDAPKLTDDDLKKTFGMPDAEVWAYLLPNISNTLRDEAHELTEQLIHDGMQQHPALLPGALPTLETLRARGYRLTVASNCGEKYLAAVMATQGIGELMEYPLCLGGVRGRRKADILTRHFERFPSSNAWMIGDRLTDVEAAHTHGIRCIGCNFGFGNEAELEGADCIIHCLPELLDIFPQKDE